MFSKIVDYMKANPHLMNYDPESATVYVPAALVGRALGCSARRVSRAIAAVGPTRSGPYGGVPMRPPHGMDFTKCRVPAKGASSAAKARRLRVARWAWGEGVSRFIEGISSPLWHCGGHMWRWRTVELTTDRTAITQIGVAFGEIGLWEPGDRDSVYVRRKRGGRRLHPGNVLKLLSFMQVTPEQLTSSPLYLHEEK